MPDNHTARYELPLLAVGQAHKEVFHNEALLRIDFMLNPVVQAVENDPANIEPDEGRCWLVGTSPAGDWAGRPDQIAGWTQGGWRFFDPPAFLRVMIAESETYAVFTGSWQFSDALTGPAGGNNADPEARAAIDSILSLLRRAGFAR